MRLLGLCTLAATGCAAVADGTYVGVPLITLHGDFSATSKTIDVDDGKLALLWQDPSGDAGPGVAVTELPYTTGELGAFTASVLSPAPANVVASFADGSTVAEAFVHYITEFPIAINDVDLGLDTAHVVIFADHDIAAGDGADYLGGAVTAGYHLRTFTVTTTPGEAQQQLIAQCTATTGDAESCADRRDYQLSPADDTDLLQITLRVR